MELDVLERCMQDMQVILDRMVAVVSPDGKVIAATHEGEIGRIYPNVAVFFASSEKVAVQDEMTMMKMYIAGHPKFAVVLDGTDAQAHTYVSLIERWLLAELEDEVHEADFNAFLKNILLENELPGDIPLKARDFKIAYASRRCAFLVNVKENDYQYVIELIRNLHPNRQQDFIMPIDQENIVLLKDLQRDEAGTFTNNLDIDEVAKDLFDALNKDLPERFRIGVGMVSETLKDVSKSYREATLALIIGRIFTPENDIMKYEKLGLGRLIYQLSPTLCKMFLEEVFPDNSYYQLDNETLLTIDKFFENNLNGSETSRQLFVHRNTLVYRLDKVQKLTNLDLRSFDDAVLFKLASMVRLYLEYQERQNFMRREDMRLR